MSISERLLELRRNSGDSQEQLADKLEVSRQAVSKWESGQGNPDLDNIMKISEIYGVSTDYILKGIPSAYQPEMQKKQMSPEYRKALAAIMIVAGTALVTGIFIAGLALLTRFMG